jgi:transposase
LRRKAMLRAVRAGMNIRQAGQQFGFPKSTVAFWVQRTYGECLDRIDLANRKPGRASNRTAFDVEQRIAQLRIDLRGSVLGEYGAGAIRTALQAEMARVPSESSVNRVLARLGLQDGVRRIRRPAPPKGWYLPSVVAGQTEVDCFDFITELKIASGPLIDVLTAKSLHGSLTDAWAIPRSTASTIPLLLARWQRDGLPAYAQFDNDNVFQGAHHHAHAVGRVSRLCLQLGVAPVFVPPLEHGMQNTIESFNALWQAKVWLRHRVADVAELQACSDRYISAHRGRTQALAEAAPRRQAMPKHFRFDPHAPLRGHIVFIRRTDETGHVHLLGQRFAVSPNWVHRLVRCEVDFDHSCIRCFALRRRAPAEQPSLQTIPYCRPDKALQGAV